MATREEMLAELDGMDLPERTLEMFRRVINTVEDDLTDEQWRDYELELDQYQKTMGMIRTGIMEGREQGREEGRQEKSREIAKAMKDNDIEAAVIAKCTGLDLETIGQL